MLHIFGDVRNYNSANTKAIRSKYIFTGPENRYFHDWIAANCRLAVLGVPSLLLLGVRCAWTNLDVTLGDWQTRFFFLNFLPTGSLVHDVLILNVDLYFERLIQIYSDKEFENYECNDYFRINVKGKVIYTMCRYTFIMFYYELLLFFRGLIIMIFYYLINIDMLCYAIYIYLGENWKNK